MDAIPCREKQGPRPTLLLACAALPANGAPVPPEERMMTTDRWRAYVLAACVSLLLVAGRANAEEVPMVTGEHWMKSSDEIKKA